VAFDHKIIICLSLNPIGQIWRNILSSSVHEKWTTYCLISAGAEAKEKLRNLVHVGDIPPNIVASSAVFTFGTRSTAYKYRQNHISIIIRPSGDEGSLDHTALHFIWTFREL